MYEKSTREPARDPRSKARVSRRRDPSSSLFPELSLVPHSYSMDDHDDIDILASSTVGEMLPSRSIGHKNQSSAWDHFDKLPDPNPLFQAKCRHCGALIKYSSGTTAMHTHLDRCKKKSNIMSKRKKSYSSSMIITPSSSSMIDQEACLIALVKLFVALELSFRTIEHEAFREYF
ncbi:hypothetical protein JHK82_025014 [Glycine max]|nr:hypothetical protein JHK85_025631 [Glycine max]KAG5133826.1 hypothetical protein JHK82_025014 [Glycine max]